MAKNWAIIIGINGYTFLDDLKWATRDAQMMAQFLKNNHFKVWHFSTKVSDSKMQPSHACIRYFLKTLKQQELGKDDNFWFFFSGHGSVHDGEDYLMLTESNPIDIYHTAIPTKFVIDELKKVHAGNIYLFLDACRNTGNKSLLKLGDSTIEEARSKNIIVFFSCSHGEFSYEIDSLKHGSFTCALLEGLKNPVKKNNLQELASYVTNRVTELNSKHKKSKQSPCLYIETITETSGAVTSFFSLEENIYLSSKGTSRISKTIINLSRFSIIPILIFGLGVFAWLYLDMKLVLQETCKTAKTKNEKVIVVCRSFADSKPKPATSSPESKASLSNRVHFVCENVYGITTTLVILPGGDNNKRQFIRWVSDVPNYTPEKRCEYVTKRLNFAFREGSDYITHGTMNGHNVICTTDKSGEECQYLLFTLKPGQDPKSVLSDLFSFGDNQFAGRPLRL
jgi:hypothetical protein